MHPCSLKCPQGCWLTRAHFVWLFAGVRLSCAVGASVEGVKIRLRLCMLRAPQVEDYDGPNKFEQDVAQILAEYAAFAASTDGWDVLEQVRIPRSLNVFVCCNNKRERETHMHMHVVHIGAGTCCGR